jgi:hypothetical protein
MVSMKKLIILASFCLLLSACEKPNNCDDNVVSTSGDQSSQDSITGGSNCPAPTPTPSPEDPAPTPEDPSPSPEEPAPTPEDPSPSPEDPAPTPDTEVSLPREVYLFDAQVKFTNFDLDDQDKVNKAIEIIKTVVRSEEFRDRIVNFTYQGKKQFVDNKGLSNEQIYQILLDGKEDLLPVVDNEMDLDLELYYSWRSTVGYTYPNTLRIWMNTKFFNYYTPAEVAGNVFHEWTHKLGFDHASSYSTSRDSSVPYAIGYLMEELGKKHE